ncbi:MAG: hypothetical protein WAR83_00950 [Flavobacteriales bacterium]|nr:hypothetical protein [Flavobacteriales bacterium]
MKVFLLFIMFASCANMRAQVVDQPIVINGHFDKFTTDELGNSYALRGDELELFNAEGKSWLRNSVKTFGRIGTIDAFYSLKPMLFAPEQGQLVVLDNTLSVQGSVMNLSRSGYTQVVLACMSVQNHFWFYDEREMALVRANAQLRRTANTGRIDQLLGFTVQPISMQEHENWLFVHDKEHGLLVFDLFGTYARTIPLLNMQSFEVRGGVIYFYGDDGLQRYDMRSFEITPIEILLDENTTIRDVRVELGKAYVLLEESILILPLNGPR